MDEAVVTGQGHEGTWISARRSGGRGNVVGSREKGPGSEAPLTGAGGNGLTQWQLRVDANGRAKSCTVKKAVPVPLKVGWLVLVYPSGERGPLAPAVSIPVNTYGNPLGKLFTTFTEVVALKLLPLESVRITVGVNVPGILYVCVPLTVKFPAAPVTTPRLNLHRPTQ